RPAAQQARSSHRRQGLRLRRSASALEVPWCRTDRAASSQPNSRGDPGRAAAAALSAPLEGRAHVRVAAELPPPGHALRAPRLDVPRVCTRRLPHHHPASLMKQLLASSNGSRSLAVPFWTECRRVEIYPGYLPAVQGIASATLKNKRSDA